MESSATQFVFVCCQVGAESALKAELSREHPVLRLAFSRPGFVTFKITDPNQHQVEQPLRSVFARTCGVALKSVTGDIDERITMSHKLLPQLPFEHIHVWNRHDRLPGERGFEPFQTPEQLAIGKQLRDASDNQSLRAAAINRTAKVNDLVADLIVIDEKTWFVGWHRAASIATQWPGGIPPLKQRSDVVSRAFWKMEEALRWSRLPIREGDHCVELGSSPGGSCQCLLEKGMNVVGIDPATMDDRVLRHPGFTYVQARAADLKRKEFAETRWLFSDVFLTPTESLDMIEHIVTNRQVNISGMLLTLKLFNWEMADEIEGLLERIRAWNFRFVRARQLAFNRREVCVLAVRRKQILRQPLIAPRKRPRPKSSEPKQP